MEAQEVRCDGGGFVLPCDYLTYGGLGKLKYIVKGGNGVKLWNPPEATLLFGTG